MNKLPSPSVGHDAEHPELETSHMILAQWRSSKKCPAQVQQFKVIISGLLVLHCIIIVHEQFITQSSHVIRDEEIIAGRCEDFSVNKWPLFLETLEQSDIRR